MPWTLSDRAQPVSPLPLHTVDTARLLGLSLRGAGWVRLRRGVYVERAGFQALSAAQRYAVRVHAYLHGHPDAVLCLESAAVLHGIPHFGETRDIHVFAPGQRTSTRQADVVTHTSRDGREIERIGGVWVTSLSDTLIDLARLMPPAHALAMMDAATAPAQGGPLRIDALRDRAQRQRDRRGSVRLRWAVEHADALAESVAESISRAVILWAGFETPVLQRSLRYEGHRDRVDFFFPSRKTVGEADGWGKCELSDAAAAERALSAEKRREDRLRRHGHPFAAGTSRMRGRWTRCAARWSARESRSCVRRSRFCSPPSARIPGRSGEKDVRHSEGCSRYPSRRAASFSRSVLCEHRRIMGRAHRKERQNGVEKTCPGPHFATALRDRKTMAAKAQGTPNWFAIGISAAVVVVLVALGAFVVFLNNQATAPGTAPESSAIVNSETGAISFGKGETEIDTYIDFMCPICGQFEDAYGEALQTAAANDDITLNIHPISILNHVSQGTDYSSRAASAMYCVAGEAPDSALTFMNLLFENQPGEGSGGLTDEELTAFAEQAGAGAAADCIADGTYMTYSEDQVDNTPADPATGRVGTPTVAIDGERIDNGEIGSRFAEILG